MRVFTLFYHEKNHKEMCCTTTPGNKLLLLSFVINERSIRAFLKIRH